MIINRQYIKPDGLYKVLLPALLCFVLFHREIALHDMVCDLFHQFVILFKISHVAHNDQKTYLPGYLRITRIMLQYPVELAVITLCIYHV